jgi:hypothetical protein
LAAGWDGPLAESPPSCDQLAVRAGWGPKVEGSLGDFDARLRHRPALFTITSSMLGSIVEKDVPAPTAPSLPSARPGNVGGFPQATHRSTSRFALAKATAASRGKGPAAPAGSRPARAPALQTTSPNPDEAPPQHSISSKPPGSETEEARIRREVSAENDARLAAMTAEEVLQEREELLARFGPGLLDVLRKRRETRAEPSATGASAASSAEAASTSVAVAQDDDDELPPLVEDGADSSTAAPQPAVPRAEEPADLPELVQDGPSPCRGGSRHPCPVLTDARARRRPRADLCSPRRGHGRHSSR